MSRTANPDKARPFSIRLTDSEKATLTQKAAGAPLGIFIRGVILDEEVKPRAVRRQYPVKDGEALGQVLGLLGQSRIANNLNQLAKAANLGALPVTAETEADLRRACADVFAMRELLLRALGIQILKEASRRPTLSEVFGVRAGGTKS